MTIGSYPGNYSQRSAYSASALNDSQLQQLEHEKAILKQKLAEERNRFALSQSDEYKQLKKQLSEVEQQITQVKATERSSGASEPAAEAPAQRELTEAQRFDSFVRSAAEEHTGIYKPIVGVNGERELRTDEEDKNRLPAGIL